MSLEFFGQFLLRQGELEEIQLRQALELMQELNCYLGDLAVAEGFATEADCRRVNDEQRRKDVPFGELAMRMGVLNAIELEELLQKQQKTRVDLAAAVIELGYQPEARLRALFDQWKSEQQAEPVASTALPPVLAEHPTAATAIGLLPRLCLRVASLPVKVGRWEDLGVLPKRVLVASVEVVGTRPLRATLFADPAFGEKLARGLLGMQLDALAGELALDAVAEFLNVWMGNVVATLEPHAHGLRLEAPACGVLPTTGTLFPVVSENDGSAEIILEPL